jgi:hypothetical protein
MGGRNSRRFQQLMDLLVSTVGMTAGYDDWHSCLRLVRDRDCAAGRSTPNGARLSHGTLLPDNVIERAIVLLVRFSVIDLRVYDARRLRLWGGADLAT